MKNLNLTFFLTIVLSMLSSKSSAQDFTITNGDGVNINYRFYDTDHAEVAVCGISNYGYQGRFAIPGSVSYDGSSYSVVKIDDYTFMDYTDFTSLDVGYNVRTVGYYCFSGCTGLQSVSLPNSMLYIAEGAFMGCTGLTSFNIPSGVNSIGQYAFAECTGLTSIKVPQDVRNIWASTFEGCTYLASVEFPEGLSGIWENAFKGCESLTSIVIPNRVTRIEYDAFAGCAGLKTITIGSMVETIGEGAFNNCEMITQITCLATTPPVCADEIFEGLDKSACTLIIPEGTLDDYKNAPVWGDFLMEEHDITTIGFVEDDENGNGHSAIYDINGRKTDNLQHGINILRTSDGKTKKVLVK